MRIKHVITTIVLALFCSQPVFAQTNFNSNHFHFFYGSPIPEKTGWEKFWERFYIGVLYPFASISVKEHFTEYTGNIYDTTITRTVKNAPSFGAYIGNFYPLAYIGENSGCLVLSTEIMGSYTSWNVKAVNFTNGSVGGHDNSYTTSIAASLPIALEYKYGADGILDKYKRFMFSLGVGGAPTAYSNTYVKSSTSFQFTPFIKAEIGFFAGIGMKLRGTFQFGQLTYASWAAANRFVPAWQGGDNTTTSVTGKPAYTVSFIVFPFSGRWRNED